MDCRRWILPRPIPEAVAGSHRSCVCWGWNQRGLTMLFLRESEIRQRPLSPDNGFITTEGRAQVATWHADSREYQLLKARSNLSRDPKQLNKSSLNDSRQDSFQLGLLLYVILAGRGPFDDISNPAEMLMSWANDTPPALHTVAPEIPENSVIS